MFLAGFLLAGFNYRYNWITIPKFVVIISSITFFDKLITEVSAFTVNPPARFITSITLEEIGTS